VISFGVNFRPLSPTCTWIVPVPLEEVDDGDEAIVTVLDSTWAAALVELPLLP